VRSSNISHSEEGEGYFLSPRIFSGGCPSGGGNLFDREKVVMGLVLLEKIP